MCSPSQSWNQAILVHYYLNVGILHMVLQICARSYVFRRWSMSFTLTLGTLDTKFLCALHHCAKNLYLCRKRAGKFAIFNILFPKCWYFLHCFWFCNKQVHVRGFLENFSIYCNSLLICFNNKCLPEMSSPSRCLKLVHYQKLGILSITEILTVNLCIQWY